MLWRQCRLHRELKSGECLVTVICGSVQYTHFEKGDILINILNILEEHNAILKVVGFLINNFLEGRNQHF